MDKNLDKTVLYEKAEEMEQLLGTDELLLSLLKAMDSRELQENLEFIDRVQDTNVF